MLLRLKSLFCLAQALLMCVSQFSVYNSNFKLWVDRAALDLTSVRDFGFEPVSASELKVTEGEKKRCREWFDANIRTTEAPAYDFTAGGRSLRKNLSDWTISIGRESGEGEFYPGGKTTIISLVHKKSGLKAQVEATIYEAYAACEWTVHIKNDGSGKSPVISKFYAADCTLETGRSELYVSKGSDPDTDDFELLKTAVTPTKMIFNANGGRSESFLPYFNLCGEKFGAVVAVGWTGQWYTSLRQTAKGVKLCAKQEFFKAYLDPGQAVRSPLVSLTFYENSNALKGFESFRSMERDCVVPESIQPMNGYVIANEFSTLTCDELIEEVRSIDPETIAATDYFWMDAGWYKYNEGWYDGVGNWIPDEKRFPDTIKPLSDAMAALGKKFLLWYEPERVREGTALYNEGAKHSDWIIQIGDNLMWNMSNSEACAHLTKYIADSLEENGVLIYRQDFNFTPLEYWQKADKEHYNGRKGICENLYVTNLYGYLDALVSRIPGLMIDNCASGGKRLDIEMSRRSVPLWRSDYNCANSDGTVKSDVLEATQSMTYGLSCWLPYSGTNQHYYSQYAIRTGILTHLSVYRPDPVEYSAYDTVRGYLTENYFPLTYGGTDTEKVLAMQFGTGSSGAALIYARENVKADEYTLRINGLNEASSYRLTDMDDPSFAVVADGKTLMNSGTVVRFREKPKAAVILYSELEG